MPLLWLSLAFLAGILVGDTLGWRAEAWLSLAGLSLAALLLRWRMRRFAPTIVQSFPVRLPILPLPTPLLLLAFCLGAWRLQTVQPAWDPGFIGWYNDRPDSVVVEGLLLAPPQRQDQFTRLQVTVQRLQPGKGQPFRPVAGLLQASLDPLDALDLHYGDLVRLEGQLQSPPGDASSSYREYLQRQGITTLMERPQVDWILRDQGSPYRAALYALRLRALATVYRLFSDPEASLFAGVLLGIEGGIAAEVMDAFRESGTAHILAISGFNIALLAGLFSALALGLLGKPRRFLAAFISIAVISSYALLVGAEAAVRRAAILGGLALFARQLGRRQDGLTSLAFAAALMAAFSPNVLWDVGFQLSFTATLGLVLFAAPLTLGAARLVGRFVPAAAAQKGARLVGEYLLFTLAALLTSLPIVMARFGSYSPVALLSNPLVLPAQPPLMILGGLAVALGMLWLPLGQAAALLAWPFAAYTIRAAEFFAGLPGASRQVEGMTLPVALLFYLAIFLLAFAAPLSTALQRRVATWRQASPPAFFSSLRSTWLAKALPFLILALGALAVVVWRLVLQVPDGRMHVTILDVGTGDAVLIQAPDGRAVLVDGGPSPARLSDALGRRLPFLQQRLDWLVVAGAGDEQVGALPVVIGRFSPDQALWSSPAEGGPAAAQLQAELERLDVPVSAAQPGQILELGRGAALRVLAAGRRGAVLLLEWGDFRLLLPIGVDLKSLEELRADPALAGLSAVLLADSGYAPSNPPEWLGKLNPQVFLLSVAAGDRQGLPSPETLEALQGYNLLRTDRNGWIKLSTDGEQMWVEVEHE